MTQHARQSSRRQCPHRIFGIDIGGTTITSAWIHPEHLAEPVSGWRRIATPQPATPAAVARAVTDLCANSQVDIREECVGIAFPGVVDGGKIIFAPNLDPSWMGVDPVEVFAQAGIQHINIINDADAAALAEVYIGNPAAATGAVLVLTFGTGIGSALLLDGILWPNLELGHFPLGGRPAEEYAAAIVRERENLSYVQWTTRVSQVLHRFYELLHPRIFILGGGISDSADQWIPLLDSPIPVQAARLGAQAGVVGAAISTLKVH